MKWFIALLIVILIQLLVGCHEPIPDCSTDAECIALHGPFDEPEEEER